MTRSEIEERRTSETPADLSSSPGFNRLLVEQLSQLFAVSIAVLDRVVLTAVLYRVWGAGLFETWSVLLAIVGLIGLSEFGFNMYFSNALAFAVARGERAKAQRLYGMGVCMLAASAAVGFIVVVAYTGLWVNFRQAPLASTAPLTELFAITLLSLAAALRVAMSATYSLYRAHLQFARLNTILTSGEFLRIMSLIAIVGLEGRIGAAAVVSFLAASIIQIGYIAFDVRRRFPEFSQSPILPTTSDLSEMLRVSTAYFAQTLSIVLLTSLPLLFLNEHALAQGVIASFVIVRTLFGLPRMVLQSLGVVAGQECSRHLATNNVDAAMAILKESTRGVCVASGLLVGVLLVMGVQIVGAWLGDKSVYRFEYALAAALPLVMTAASIIAHNVLITANLAFLAAVGRLVQLLITFLAFFLLPITDQALSMLVALAFGEIIGFSVLPYIAVAQKLPSAGFTFHVKAVGYSAAACGFAVVASLTLGSLFNQGDWLALSIQATMIICCCVVGFLYLGLSQTNRSRLTAGIKAGSRYAGRANR